MNRVQGLDEVLGAVSKILLWCGGIGMALLLFWFAVATAFGDFAYGVHSSMFEISRHEFELMNYIGMGCLKMCVFVFFLAPWLATRLTLRSLNKSKPRS